VPLPPSEGSLGTGDHIFTFSQQYEASIQHDGPTLKASYHNKPLSDHGDDATNLSSVVYIVARPTSKVGEIERESPTTFLL